MLRVVIVGGFVQHVRMFREHEKSMGESCRYPDGELVGGGKSYPDPALKAGRASAHVDYDVINFAGQNPHEFALRLRILIMQAAQHIFFRARLIVLHERNVCAGSLFEVALIVAFKEIAAIVAEHAGFEEKYFRQFGR